VNINVFPGIHKIQKHPGYGMLFTTYLDKIYSLPSLQPMLCSSSALSSVLHTSSSVKTALLQLNLNSLSVVSGEERGSSFIQGQQSLRRICRAQFLFMQTTSRNYSEKYSVGEIYSGNCVAFKDSDL